MAAPILGIEYAKDSVKVIEVSFARRIKILNFAVLDYGGIPVERRGEQLQHTLKTRGFIAKQAIVAYGGPGIEHKLLSLPPLSGRELQFVMAREARKAANSKDMLWTYDTLAAKEEAGVKKTQVLLVTSEANIVRTVQEGLAATKVKILQLTTVAESMVNLLKHSGTGRKESTRCIAHFSGNRGHVAFVRDGALLLSRDIQFDYTDVAHEEQIVRLMTEIKRSGLFFRQNFPQAAIEEYLFSGDSKLLGSIAAATKAEFGVEAGMLSFDDAIDTSGLRGDWDTLRFNLPALGAALGAVWRKTPGLGINLLPNSRPASQGGAAVGRVVKFAAPAVLALTLLTGSYYYAEKSRLTSKQTDLERKDSQLQPALEKIRQGEDERQRAAAGNALLARIAPVDWIEILRNLSFIVPQSAVFDEIRVDQSVKTAVVIRGSVAAPSLSDATADFSRFFGSLRQLPRFGPPERVKPETVGNENGQFKVAFEVRCELN